MTCLDLEVPTLPLTSSLPWSSCCTSSCLADLVKPMEDDGLHPILIAQLAHNFTKHARNHTCICWLSYFVRNSGTSFFLASQYPINSSSYLIHTNWLRLLQCTIKGNPSYLPYICIVWSPQNWVLFNHPYQHLQSTSRWRCHPLMTDHLAGPGGSSWGQQVSKMLVLVRWHSLRQKKTWH